MARRVIVDYTYAGFSRGSGQRSWRRPVLVVVVLLAALLAVFGATEGRALWHAFRSHTSSTSHSLSSAQLNGVKQLANPASTSNAAVDQFNGTDTAPASAVLPVPYSVQAPGNNWKVFENACEDDALLMYHDFLDGDSRTDLPVTEVDPALRAMQKSQG